MPKISAERRAARRDQILRAAKRCAIRSGLDGMTMAQVIEESGLSAGAVYGYFDSKADLISAVVDSQLEEILQMLRSVAVADPEPSVPALMQTLAEELDKLAHNEDGDLTVMILLAWGDAAKGGPARALMGPRLEAVLSEWTVIVRRLQEAGTFDPAVPAEDLAAVLHSSLPGLILLRHAGFAPPPAAWSAAWTALLAR